MLWLYCVVALVAGVPLAFGWGKYMMAVVNGHPWTAAVWDFLIIVLASVVTLTLWAHSGDSPFVLFAYAVGSALGTLYVVKHNQKKDT